MTGLEPRRFATAKHCKPYLASPLSPRVRGRVAPGGCLAVPAPAQQYL